MAFTIQTNHLATLTARALDTTTRQMGETVQRLATGKRIVQAKDDPAGLAISETMRATIRSLGQAERNAQDAISLIQVFEGGTNEINNMLIRIRELSVQAASDTVGNKERAMLQNEVSELQSEITRIAKTTNYQDKNLLAGDQVRLDFQVGVGNDEDTDRIVFDPGKLDLTADGLDVAGIDVSSKDDAFSALEGIDSAIDQVNSVRARIGASQNRLQTTMSVQGTLRENLMAAASRIADADVARETTELAKQSILQQAGVAVLTQANEVPKAALQLLR